MNKKGGALLEASLVVFIIGVIVVSIVAAVLGLSSHMEQSLCYELDQEGFETKIIEKYGVKDCVILYNGVSFQPIDKDKILMLELIDIKKNALVGVSEQ